MFYLNKSRIFFLFLIIAFAAQNDYRNSSYEEDYYILPLRIKWTYENPVLTKRGPKID
jgi:hypothetical protein